MRLQIAAASLKAAQRLALRAAGVLAGAGVLMSTAPHAAMAQGVFPTWTSTLAAPTTATYYGPPSPQTPPTTFVLSFIGLDCLREGGGFVLGSLASDEPYVVIYAVTLNSPSSGHARTTQVFSDVDTGESRRQTLPFFAGPLDNPDDLIVLVQVMENDESNVSRITDGLASSLNIRAASLVSHGAGRDAIVENLRREMERVIATNGDIGTLNSDDFIGGTQELRITTAHTASAASGTTVIRKLEVHDGDDGDYRTYFELRKS